MEIELFSDLFDDIEPMNSIEVYPGNSTCILIGKRVFDPIEFFLFECTSIIIDDGYLVLFSWFFTNVNQRSRWKTALLRYLFDEMILGSNDIIERYIWNLTYTPGTPPPPDGGTVPGFTIL